ncbi:MAG: 2OG-Fe(II) oxygenase [Rhodoferax sp.]|nr:2OG-Fe(II) oxygenase [Rhodoferax sp.]
MTTHMTGDRLAAIDWDQVVLDLDAQGGAVIKRLIAPAECQAMAALYSMDKLFRSRVVMAQHGFGRDFSGGEFVMTEQRPRMQSRAMVLPLRQGDAAVIAVHHRPVQGTRGMYRVNLRHGVSHVRAGQRHTAGIIFHDAA